MTIIENFKRFYDLDFIEINMLVVKLSEFTDAQLRNLARDIIFTDFSKFTFGNIIDFITLHKYARKAEGK